MVHHTHDAALMSMAKAISTVAKIQKRTYLRERFDDYIELTKKREGTTVESIRKNEHWHLWIMKQDNDYEVWESRGKIDRYHGEMFSSDVPARRYIGAKVRESKSVKGGVVYHKAKLV